MADILNANSTYESGTNDTASTAIDQVTLHAAKNINGALSASVQIETILGIGTTLKGSKADLVARLAVGITGAGVLKVNDATAFPGPLDVARGGTGSAVAALGAPSGTLMLFQQTTAPTGWTKQSTHNDKGLRVVTGTAGSGGTNAYSAVFPQPTTGSHVLTLAELPAHDHGSTGGHTHIQNIQAAGVGATFPDGSAGDGTDVNAGATDSAGGHTHASVGSGSGHTHALTMDLQFVDVIIASKD